VTDRADLLSVIKAKAVIHGDVVLSSGQTATWYIDLRRVLLDGRAAPLAQDGSHLSQHGHGAEVRGGEGG